MRKYKIFTYLLIPVDSSRLYLHIYLIKSLVSLYLPKNQVVNDEAMNEMWNALLDTKMDTIHASISG